MAAQQKRIGESKVIAARAEVEAAKLMRQAADILSSAPAMQIRYLEAMQAMAKSANSKVIFLPGPGGSTAAATSETLKKAGEQSVQEAGEGSSSGNGDFGMITGDDGFQRALQAQVTQNI